MNKVNLLLFVIFVVMSLFYFIIEYGFIATIFIAITPVIIYLIIKLIDKLIKQQSNEKNRI
jgi:hypothetical protein